MNRTSETLYSLLAIAFGIYVLIRAWAIPITVDECSTAVSHVPRTVQDLLFFQNDINPNNHILNTIAIKAFTGLFGWHPFVVRIPAILGGLAYAWVGLLLCRRLSASPWVGLFVYVLLLTQPYALSFFSLARGYALGMGLMLLAIWQAKHFLEDERKDRFTLAIVFAGLAVYANFTQLLFFVPFTGLLFLQSAVTSTSFRSFWKKSNAALLVSLAWVVLLSIPLRRLNSSPDFQGWVEIHSLLESAEKSIRVALHYNPLFDKQSVLYVTYLVVFFTIGITGVALKKWVQQQFRFSTDYRVFIVFVLAGELITNVLLVESSHGTYLEQRLALLFWPPFALSIGIGAAWLYESYGKWAWCYMAPLGLLAVGNMAVSANLSESLEWWQDRDTYMVIDYLHDLQKSENHPEPYTFDTGGVMQNSFIFHTDLDPRGFNKIIQIPKWHPDRVPTQDFEFYYASSEEDAKPLLETHDVVFKAPRTSRLLLRKKK